MDIRVLVVDDQAIVRQGLTVILQHQPGITVCGAARDGEEALSRVVECRPDVVLMDLNMPGLNGIHATRRIVEQFPAIHVVILTTYDDDEWVFDAIRAGARGYLLKDCEADEILAAIRGVMAGEVRIDPAVAGKVLHEFRRLAGGPVVRHRSATEPQLESLTERELAVLQEMAQGKSNREIAEALYLSEGTVKNYVSAIIAKLQANDRTQATIMALKRGLATLD